MKKKIFERVHEIVRSVPPGRVTTYGDVAFKLSSEMGFPSKKLSRVVGYALHANKNNDLTPCHRVVNKEGRVAPGFAFGGADEQQLRLEKEGVGFLRQGYVDMEKYSYRFYENS